jgi:hypothetical protein
MRLNGPGTIAVQGNFEIVSQGIIGDANVSLTGSANQAFTVGSSYTIPSGTITINKTGGTVTPSNNLTFNNSGQDFTITAGTLNLASYNLTVNDVLTIASGGSVTLTGDQTITTGATIFNGSATYTGTNTYTTLRFGNSYGDLTISGNGTYSPTGTLTISDDFAQSTGTFNAPTNMVIGGDITLTGGTFNEGSNTITLNTTGNTANISGAISFYNLTVVTGNKTIVLDETDLYEVTNTLVMRGSAAEPIYLLSSTPGDQATFNVTYGSPSLAGVVGRDINSCGGFVVNVTQGGSNGNVSCWTFTVDGYYDAAWTERKRLKIEADEVVGGPHENFPVLVQLTSYTPLSSGAQADGDDILFTSSDGIFLLDFELESYSAGTLLAWVKMPSISSTVDTFLYMYYNNPAATSSLQDPEGTFDNGYSAVWHMEESPTAGNNEILDSTANNRDGSAGSALTSSELVTGYIGNGLDFDGGGGNNSLVRVAAGAGLNNVSTGSISTWVQWRGNQNGVFGGKNGPIMAREQNGVFGNNIIALNGTAPATSKLVWSFNSGGTNHITSTNNVGNNTWRYVTVTFTSGDHKLYMDGAQEGTSTTAGSTNNNSAIDYTFGGWEGQNMPNIIMDELRISSVVRSANWIATEYSNMSDPTAFAAISDTGAGNNKVKFNGGARIQGGTKVDLD